MEGVLRLGAFLFIFGFFLVPTEATDCTAYLLARTIRNVVADHVAAWDLVEHIVDALGGYLLRNSVGDDISMG